MSNARTLANIINANSEIVVPSGGIQFADATNANTVANESNLIEQDGYEEGTYQVTLAPNSVTEGVPSGSFTMDTSRNTFKYIKIGNVCHVFGYTRTSTVSSPTGYITFNLPFTSAASTEYSGYTFGICIPENISTINSNELSVQIGPSTSTAQIYRTGGGGSFANWINFANYFTTFTNITVMITYETA